MMELITLGITLLKGLFNKDKDSGPSSRTAVIVFLIALSFMVYGVYQYRQLKQKYDTQVVLTNTHLMSLEESRLEIDTLKIQLQDRQNTTVGTTLSLHRIELDILRDEIGILKRTINSLHEPTNGPTPPSTQEKEAHDGTTYTTTNDDLDVLNTKLLDLK